MLELVSILLQSILVVALSHLLNLGFLDLKILAKKLLSCKPIRLTLFSDHSIGLSIENGTFLLLILTVKSFTNEIGISVLDDSIDKIAPLQCLLDMIGDGADRWVYSHQ